MPAPDCPSRDDLLAYVTDRLTGAERTGVTEHVRHCGDCRAALEDFRTTGSTRVSPQTPSAPPSVHAAYQVAAERAGAGPRRGAGPAEVLPGERLGSYVLLEKLGEGGMGAVYKARHTLLGQVVALKLLPAWKAEDPEAVARFRREIEAVGRLNHPHIVAARDAGESDGRHFLVMELVEGLDLAKLLKRHGRLPVPDACEAVRQAALGLGHAHGHHLVHRDVKPSNLLLTPAGQVKLLDLGLARFVYGERPSADDLTGTGQVLGTADFLAPEQVEHSPRVDGRADLYGLGCTLYALLAGHPPFGYGQNLYHKLRAHLEDPTPPLRGERPEVPEALAAVVHRLLAKDPAARFATADDVAAALQPFTAGADLARLPAPDARADAAGPAPGREARSTPSDPHATLRSAVPGPAVPPVARGTVGRTFPETATPVPAPPHGPRRRVLVLAAVGLLMASLAALVLAWPRPAPSGPAAPSIERLRFYVRRQRQGEVFRRELVANGSDQDPDPIDPPLRPGDFFQVEGRLSQPADWYLVWFDTAGVVKVEGHSPAPQTLVEYPAGDDFIGVNPDDPPGIHLLALVAGRMSPGEALPLLEQRLADVGKPPTTLPRRWSEQVRGAGRKFGEPVVLPSRYLRGIAERLPPGLELVHAIFLRTEK